MKSQDKLVTLCSHKAVAPSWQNLSRQKSYAMKQQPFSIYCEKFPLGLSHLQLDPQREVRNRPDLPAYPRVGYEVNLRAAAAPFLLTPTPYRTSFEKIT